MVKFNKQMNVNICTGFKFGTKFIHVMTICYVEHQKVFQSKRQKSLGWVFSPKFQKLCAELRFIHNFSSHVIWSVVTCLVEFVSTNSNFIILVTPFLFMVE